MNQKASFSVLKKLHSTEGADAGDGYLLETQTTTKVIMGFFLPPLPLSPTNTAAK